MSSSPPNKTLLEWVRKRKADLSPGGQISKIELWHVVDGEAGERMCVFNLEERNEDEDPDDLCQEIWNEAMEDAETRVQGSMQRYVVQAYKGSDTQPDETKPFLLTGRAMSSLIGNGSETPTNRGLIAQEMRQNDNLHAMVIRLCESSAGTLARQNQELREETSKLYAERRQYAELEQKMLDRQHERDMEREEKARASEQWGQLVSMALGLGPMILSKFLAAGPVAGSFGPPQPPGAPNVPPAAGGASPAGGGVESTIAPNMAAQAARDMSAGNILATLRPEQLSAIFNLLDPQQAMALMELYQSFREDHQRQSEEKANAQETH